MGWFRATVGEAVAAPPDKALPLPPASGGAAKGGLFAAAVGPAPVTAPLPAAAAAAVVEDLPPCSGIPPAVEPLPPAPVLDQAALVDAIDAALHANAAVVTLHGLFGLPR